MNAPDAPHDLKVIKQLGSTPEIRYPPDSITLMIANFSDEEGKDTWGIPRDFRERSCLSDEDDADRGTERTFFFWKQ